MVKSKEQYTVQLDPEFVKKIDRMAEKLGLSRSQLMRNLMESAYEDFLILEKIGLLTAFKFGEKIIRNFKHGVASGKITFNKDGELNIKE